MQFQGARIEFQAGQMQFQGARIEFQGSQMQFQRTRNALRPPPPPYNAEESEKIACRQPGSADRLGCMQLIQPI